MSQSFPGDSPLSPSSPPEGVAPEPLAQSGPLSPTPFGQGSLKRSGSDRPLNWERWALIALLLLGGGYGLWQWLGPKPGGPGGPPGGGGPPAGFSGPPPRPVVTTLLKSGGSGQTVRLIGQVEDGDSITLRSQVSGLVEAVNFKAGEVVASGDIIAIVDSADQQLALAEAEARLAEAESTLAELERGTRSEVIAQRRAAVQATEARENEARDNVQRLTKLVNEGAVTERLLIEARADLAEATSDRLGAAATLAEAEAGPRRDEINVERANVAAERAAVNQAFLALQRTRIVATAGGVVNDTVATVGDYLQTADPVMELINNDTIDILLEIPELLTAQIQPGQAVTLLSRALPGWRGQAAIDSLTPIASPTSRSRAARIRLANPPPGLLPGAALGAELALTQGVGSYQISRDALTRRDGQWFVYGVQSGPEGQMSADEIAVELMSDNGETVLIDSPELQANQEIVLKGSDGLQDAAPLMVVEGPSAGPPPGSPAVEAPGNGGSGDDASPSEQGE